MKVNNGLKKILIAVFIVVGEHLCMMLRKYRGYSDYNDDL